jgi:hypothetical protein
MKSYNQFIAEGEKRKARLVGAVETGKLLRRLGSIASRVKNKTIPYSKGSELYSKEAQRVKNIRQQIT